MKIGIFGFSGSIGYRHATNFAKLGCTVMGYDPLAQEGFRSEKELLDQRPDGLVIASPTSEHLRHILMGMERNIPMLVEKPIVDAIDHNIALIMETHTPILVGYNLRFHSIAIQVKEWLTDGRIGDPLWAEISCRQLNTKYRRDNLILNWSHEIDLAQYWLGPSLDVRGAYLNEANTVASIIASSRNECVIDISLDYISEPQWRGGTIQGTDGAIHYDLVDHKRAAHLSMEDLEKSEVFRSNNTFDDDYLVEANAFKHFLETGDHGKLATKAQAINVAEFCHQATLKGLKR